MLSSVFTCVYDFSELSEEEELIEDDTRDNAPAINLDADSDDEPDNNNQ